MTRCVESHNNKGRPLVEQFYERPQMDAEPKPLQSWSHLNTAAGESNPFGCKDGILEGERNAIRAGHFVFFCMGVGSIIGLINAYLELMQ